jgi:hypothetical protein
VSSGGSNSSNVGDGSRGSSDQLRQYANASARSDPWTPYSIDQKRTGKVFAELDDILTKYERGAGGAGHDDLAN